MRWALALVVLLAAAPPAVAAPQESGSADTAAPAAGGLPRLRLVMDEPAGEDGEGRDLTTSIEIVLLLTFLTLLPPLLLSVTCFTRVVIVLSFVRRAMATPELPPNPVLIGLALFLTAAVMQPVAASVHDEAIKPYLDREIGFVEAGSRASGHLRGFLMRHTRESDVALFLEMSDGPPVEGPEDLPLRVVVPAFVLSELTTAFRMGFVLFLPFLVVDLVVASILLSMGMFMLPPMLIATPIKILLFVLVDGWGLVVGQLWTGLRGVA